MAATLETSYFKKDLTSFVKAVEQARASGTLDKEFSNVGPQDNKFKKGTALTTIVALTPFDNNSLPFVQALLEGGANPNHKNITMGGLTPLDNLVINAEPHFVYGDPEQVDNNVLELLKLLLSYGVDTSQYEGKADTQVGRVLDELLLNYATEIDTETDQLAFQRRLCADLSKENNVTQLRLLAKSLGLSTTGRKAELCSIIAQQLVATAATIVEQ
jgi:hypothetical protein